MIRHIVLLQIPSHIAQSDIDTMIGELEKVAFSVPGAIAFCGGAKMTGSGLGGILAISVNVDDIHTPDKGSDKKPELRWI